MARKILDKQQISLGTDPEFFFKEKATGDVIGSEKVLPKTGLKATGGEIAMDGVQVEIHPAPNSCREVLQRNIRSCLASVKLQMDAKGVVADFSQVIEIKKERLDEMADENKVFGCSESYNNNQEGKNKVSVIKADPLKYMKRSAGGHIHLGAVETISVPDGHNEYGTIYKQAPNPWHVLLKQPERLIPIMDILVGNTAVLLDRDKGNAERRKNYGKAGEYRLPKYGIEYRTLSNFWLRGSPLFSLMFGLARQSVNLVADSGFGHNYEKRLLKLVDMEDIIEAINENDFNLAYRNFKKIEDFIVEYTSTSSYGFNPLNKETMAGFHTLVERGLGHYFKQEPMDAWLAPKVGYENGYRTFHERILSQG